LAHRRVLERCAKPAVFSADKRESLNLIVGDRILLTDSTDGQDGASVSAEWVYTDGLDHHLRAPLPALEDIAMVPFDLRASDQCFTQKDHISRVFGKDAAKAAPKIDVIEPMLTTFPPPTRSISG
jgi:hypothetical protein